MLTDDQIAQCNSRLVEALSAFLNLAPDSVKADAIDTLVKECGVTPDFAFSVTLAAFLGFDLDEKPEDKALFDHYFPRMVHRLDAEAYRRDPYLENVRIPEAKAGRWELRLQRYEPFEAFVCNDLETLPDGRIVPQIGYFDRAFPYPAVLEDGQEWMLVTPNEIETMRPALSEATGRVLTYGLGLGYFAFRASEKSDVSSVTCVEKDSSVIELFERFLLPQFPHRDKIQVVQDDAFAYAEKRMAAGGFDLVFTDLWHDPSDGVELYLRMKQHEARSSKSRFAYWIEKTLLHYL